MSRYLFTFLALTITTALALGLVGNRWLLWQTPAFAEGVPKEHTVKSHSPKISSHKTISATRPSAAATTPAKHHPTSTRVRVKGQKPVSKSHTQINRSATHHTVHTKSVHQSPHSVGGHNSGKLHQKVHHPKLSEASKHKLIRTVPFYRTNTHLHNSHLEPAPNASSVEGGLAAESTDAGGLEASEKEQYLVGNTWQHEPMVLLAVDMSPELAEEASKAGFEIIQYIRLKNLGITIAKIKVESREQEKKIRQWLKERGIHYVIYNDFYVLNQGSMFLEFEDNFPWGMLGWPNPCLGCGRNISIGMVDAKVDMELSALSSKRITQEFFTPSSNSNNIDHGTSIAAILVGDCQNDFCGLLPDAELFVAATFESFEEGSARATALSIARGLDWLLGKGVQVINLSFCGPDNPLLKRAIKKTLKRGVPVVAAAGNYGDKAPKVYPAAYNGVIAVTAVDKFGRPYPEANRGDYISFADPGVRVPVPDRDEQLSFKSGTSYAAAYCTALVAILAEKGVKGPEIKGLIKRLKRDAVDLGPPGKDEIFGWGLARCGEECRAVLK